MLLRELNEAVAGSHLKKLGWIYDNEQSLWRLRVWFATCNSGLLFAGLRKTIENQLTCVHVDGLFEAEFAS